MKLDQIQVTELELIQDNIKRGFDIDLPMEVLMLIVDTQSTSIKKAIETRKSVKIDRIGKIYISEHKVAKMVQNVKDPNKIQGIVSKTIDRPEVLAILQSDIFKTLGTSKSINKRKKRT